MAQLNPEFLVGCRVEGRHPYRPVNPHGLHVSGIGAEADGVSIRVDDAQNHDAWTKIFIPWDALKQVCDDHMF